jgi:preprotein translocase subunit YajC
MDLTFLVLCVFGIGMLWFMSNRNRKQQQEAVRFRDSLEPGQEVRTIGGMFGTVVEVEGDRVTLELSSGVTGQWAKHSIAMLVLPPIEDEDAVDEEYEDEDYEEYDEDSEGGDEESEGDEGLAGDEEVAAQDWQGVVVPDDASSLASDEDDDNHR